MKEYIEREAALKVVCEKVYFNNILPGIKAIPAADVVEEENVLKFYYVRSIDEYWIGRRIDNFYYAEYDASCGQWVWSHSRYLPWGQHVVAPGTLWKEHTYPSEPEEIPFGEWLTGFIKKNNAADVVEVRHGRWILDDETGVPICSVCYSGKPTKSVCSSVVQHTLGNHEIRYCYFCGAKMDGGADDDQR